MLRLLLWLRGSSISHQRVADWSVPGVLDRTVQEGGVLSLHGDVDLEPIRELGHQVSRTGKNLISFNINIQSLPTALVVILLKCFTTMSFHYKILIINRQDHTDPSLSSYSTGNQMSIFNSFGQSYLSVLVPGTRAQDEVCV